MSHRTARMVFLTMASIRCISSLKGNLQRQGFHTRPLGVKGAGILLCAFLCPVLLLAQGGEGSIQGSIKDPTGAVVAGATVSIRNLDTNVTRTVVSEITGFFIVPALVAGQYEVKAEHAGFKTVSQEGIVLTVSQQEVIHFTLPIGTTSESVEVTTTGTLINTTDNSIGNFVGEHAIQDLPLNGRNYVDLSLMEPGTDQDYAITVGTGASSSTTFSNHGSTPWSNLFTLDGAILNNALALNSSSQTGSTLGLDGIQEFKIVSIPDASYGLVMGGQVVMASRSGTNKFHGDVFEYVRNAVFDARNYFDYGYQTGTRRLPNFVQNQFGGALGGPIRKDKTFFFGVYESLRNAQGATILDTVPNANCVGGANTVVWNGTGTQPAGSIGPCTQLGANPSGAGTNSVKISPVMAPLLAIYPAANLLATNQFTAASSAYVDENFAQGRIDHTLSGKDSLFGRYTFDKGDVNNNTAFPMWRQLLPGTNQFLTLGETHIFSASLLNALRLSVSRTTQQTINTYPGNTQYNDAQHQFVAGLNMGVWGTLSASGAPGGNIAGLGAQATKPSLDNLTLYTFSDDISVNKSHHTLSMGTLLNLYRQGAGTNANATGTLAFASFATFLQGTISSASVLSLPPGIAPVNNAPNINRYFGYSTYGFYAQDDWRAMRRLTVDLGLRYEFMDTVNELNGNGYAMVNLPTATGPTKGPILANPTLKNFSPRVGFAWDVFGNGKTSLRGGFGIYRDIGNLGSELREQLQGTPPWAVTTVGTFAIPANGPLTTIFQQPGSIGKSLATLGYSDRPPYEPEYNLTAERQIFGVSVSATYIGLHGIHLWTRGEGNPVNPAGFLPNGRPYYNTYNNPTTGVPAQPPCEFTAQSVNGVLQFCRQNPLYSAVTLDQTAGTSWYNAGEVNIVKQLSHGIEFQTSYTWSKSVDDTEDMGGFESTASGCVTNSDPLDRRSDRGPSCFDTTNKWNANLIYHLPKLQTAHFVSALINGWYVGNIVTIQSGMPFTPIIGTGVNRSDSGVFVQSVYNDHVNVNTVASIAANPCTSQPGQPAMGSNPCAYTPVPYDKKTVALKKVSQWYNPAMFSMAPVGQLGNAGRDMLRTPSLLVWNASAVKDTPVRFLGDKGALQFRAELFNPLNKTNFGYPSATVFAGKLTDIGPFSEVPNVGNITSTITKNRQIQFALKVIF